MTHTPIAPRDAATRFFWSWLAIGTATSVLGNVTHALLNPAVTHPGVAAAVAVVPPVALLGATHGVHALVKSRIMGAAYRAALTITVAVALAAFVLSFTALRDLSIMWAGVPPTIAWLVPVVVDLSITGSTIALLALSGAQRNESIEETNTPGPSVHVEVHNDVHAVAQVAELQVHEVEHIESVATHELGQRSQSVHDILAREAAHDGAVAAQLRSAEAILATGRVRIDRVKVATVLAQHADGTAPSMIARKASVGYDTVKSILEIYNSQDVLAPAT